MSIKVYGIPMSTATSRVLATLHEKELEYELIPIDMRAGQHKKEPYLSLNPFGQVPAFEDGDLKLFESRAITSYISNNYADKGSQLVSHEPKVMANIAVWMEVEAHKFDDVASKLCSELVIKPMFGRPIDEAAVEEHEQGLAKVLDIYESRLKESKYLGGQCFTLADLHHLPLIQYLMATKAKALFASRPHVTSWCDHILARPAWSKVVSMQKH